MPRDVKVHVEAAYGPRYGILVFNYGRSGRAVAIECQYLIGLI